MNIIEIKNAKIGYSDKNVLFDDFNLSVNKGEFISILGKTGIGKTTILKLIIGLNKLIDGELLVKGDMSLCFQDSRLFPHMNVYENLGYPLSIKIKDKYKRIKEVDEILKSFDIEDLKDKMPDTLSGGEKKRVALARCLIVKPEILLLDEPTSNLDFDVKANIRELIKSMHLKYNCTTIMVTHDIFDSLYLSDKLLILENKKVVSFVEKNKIAENEDAINYLKSFFDETKIITNALKL